MAFESDVPRSVASTGAGARPRTPARNWHIRCGAPSLGFSVAGVGGSLCGVTPEVGVADIVRESGGGIVIAGGPGAGGSRTTPRDDALYVV
jgi:hypothetical protein